MRTQLKLNLVKKQKAEQKVIIFLGSEDDPIEEELDLEMDEEENLNQIWRLFRC